MMPFFDWQTGLLSILLALLGYALFQSWQSYRRRWDGMGFLKMAVLFVAAVGVWLQLYGTAFDPFLAKYRVVLGFVPLVFFFAYQWTRPQTVALGSAALKSDFLESYVSPHVVTQLRQKGYVPLGGHLRDVTVLVTDVRNSTGMCVSYPPDVVLRSLNRYFEVVTDAVTKHGGTVDKLTGDGVMAVFNAPNHLDDHTGAAFQAAQDIQQRMVKVNQRLTSEGLPYLNVGVGLDSGIGVLGNIGSRHMVRYTVIGDVANTASRVQEFAKSGQVVLTPNAYRRLSDRISATSETVQVKGKGRMSIYKVSVA